MGNFLSDSGNVFPIYIRDKHKFGWIPDIPDIRDIYANIPDILNNELPKKVDLRDTGNMPNVYNQQTLGSCSACAISAAFEYDCRKQHYETQFTPSIIFLYYNQRIIENTIEKDTGASIRDGLKVLHKLGVCYDTNLPYDVRRFNIQPTQQTYESASEHRYIKYRKIKQNRSIYILLSLGVPVIFGMSVYESFLDNKGVLSNGVLKLPKNGERLVGGHVALIIGFDFTDISNKMFLVRNSMGYEWGDEGHFWIPYEYVMNPDYCSDFWTLEKIINPNETSENTYKNILTNGLERNQENIDYEEEVNEEEVDEEEVDEEDDIIEEEVELDNSSSNYLSTHTNFKIYKFNNIDSESENEEDVYEHDMD